MRRNKYFVDKWSDNRLFRDAVSNQKLWEAAWTVGLIWYADHFYDYESFHNVIKNRTLLDNESYKVFMEYVDSRAKSANLKIEECFIFVLIEAQQMFLITKFKLDGSNIFVVEPGLADMLRKTDLDDSIKLADLKSPFPDKTIYIDLPGCGCGDIWPADSEFAGIKHESLLTGVFVEYKAPKDSKPTSGSMQDRALYGPRLDIRAIWETRAKTTGEVFLYVSSYEFKPYLFSGKYVDIGLNEWYRTFWGKVNPSSGNRDVFNLVINILLYLQYQDRDVKYRWPDDISFTLKKSLQGKKKQQEKAEATLKKRGYSKIHFCGYQMQKEYERLYAETGREVNPHWRRGHWRNQACGPRMKEHKLVWIKPMIVRRDKGEPEYGHIYHVGDTVQP